MLDYATTFPLSAYDPTRSPNIQVCIYATATAWANTYINLKNVDVIGATSLVTYTHNSAPQCTATPPGTALLSGVTAQLTTTGLNSDTLSFSLRLPANATGLDQVIVQVLEQDSSGNWTSPVEGADVSNLQPFPASNNVFVANDADSCGANSPCYINTTTDYTNGYGTGLKDAVDAVAVPGTVNILGNNTLKSNAVLVDKALTINGIDNASLTYAGHTNGCDINKPMLHLTAGSTITNLKINDGECGTNTSPDRILLSIDQSTGSTVRVESNDLNDGQDAITVLPTNQGNVTVRFNEIKGNSGHALVVQSGNSNSWILNFIANNVFMAQTGTQVECNGRVTSGFGSVDHNYWGAGSPVVSVLPSLATSNCNVTSENDNKRLGAAILHNTGKPGVSALQALVTTNKGYYFNNQIAVQRSSTSTRDFNLYIVNHGYGSNQNIPFTGSQPGNLSPCSNFWDIFLDDGTIPLQNLSLFFKYNISTGCVELVESASYCGQNDPNRFPLWWYNHAVASWLHTGQAPAGQTTVCQAANDEIQLNLVSSGNPSLNNLLFIPFVVGVPSQPSAVQIAESHLDSPAWSWPVAAGAGLCLAASLGLILLRRNEKRGAHAK
jgi:hypothetical protein